MTFAQELADLMKEKGMTSYRLAKETGSSATTVANWLHGAVPSADKLVKIAACLGVSVESLIYDGLEQPEPEPDEPEELEEIKPNHGALQIFTNSDFGQVRAMEIDGVPWFVGKDVASILGYSNSRKALGDHVDEEDKGVTSCDTPGGTQKLTIINESGLYSLILSSKLPSAKEFKRWVTSEVLPLIRRTGFYSLCAEDDSVAPMRLLTPDDYLAAARLIASCKNDRLKMVVNLLAKGGWEIEEAERVTASVDTSDIAERLTSAKKKHGLTWSQLADRLNMDPAVLRVYGTGHRFPKASRYETIVKALDALGPGT
jgi:prophage antirepressor-like protein/lambda repressor-like predicted transcriptional regulator